jgi:carbonic anhydrase
MAAVRNHAGFKMAALLGPAIVLGTKLSSASPLALKSSSKSSDSFWPWMILALAVGGILTLISKYFEGERTKKIEELARSHGFTFRPTPTATDSELPIGCYLAETGRNPAVSNVLEVAQTDELHFVLFEYEYTVGYGKSQHTTHQTIGRLRAPLLKLPSFLLFPETLFSKIGVMFGRTDVNFPDSPDFSDQYILRGQDEPALRAVFSPALRQALTPLDHLTIEGADDVLFIFRTDRRVKPDDLLARIEEDKKILALFFEAQQANERRA